MQKISPCLWFDSQAEEAANLYTSIFKNSRIISVSRYGEGAPMPAGTVMTVEFELEGLKFIGLNGGPAFTFNESVSFYVNCQDQDEVDELWERLIEGGGAPSQCGWLKDKFGVSWQIIPTKLPELLGGPDADADAAGRAMHAMLGMAKIDIQGLQDAYDGKA